MDEGRMVELLQRRLAVSEKITELEGIKNEYNAAIKTLLKKKGAYTYGDYHVKWSESASKRVDIKAVKEKYPNVAAECTSTSLSERLTISKRKE